MELKGATKEGLSMKTSSSMVEEKVGVMLGNETCEWLKHLKKNSFLRWENEVTRRGLRVALREQGGFGVSSET